MIGTIVLEMSPRHITTAYEQSDLVAFVRET